jgi:hypothetical protein
MRINYILKINKRKNHYFNINFYIFNNYSLNNTGVASWRYLAIFVAPFGYAKNRTI